MTKEQELQMENYYQELLKDGKIKTLNEAFVFKLSYEKAFSLNGVGCSFFTPSDLGKEFKVIANTSGHGFEIGEIVTLLELNEKKDDEYKFAGKDDYWWCNFADVKVK